MVMAHWSYKYRILMNLITYYLVHSYNFKSWEPPVAGYKAKLKLHVFFQLCETTTHGIEA